jgi:hypothetical protein
VRETERERERVECTSSDADLSEKYRGRGPFNPSFKGEWDRADCTALESQPDADLFDA